VTQQPAAARYAKGIVGALLAFLGALSVALPDGVTGQEWIAIAITTVGVAGGAVGVPNKPAPVKP
jgi:hypothetical protein